MNLPPEFVWKVQSIKMRGSVAKLHLLTDGQHGLPDGTSVVAPSLQVPGAGLRRREVRRDLRAAVSWKSPPLGMLFHIHFQFAPYALKRWRMESGDGPRVEKLAVDTLAEYFPNLQPSIINQQFITPLDLEDDYGLTEGDLNHGQLMLDQFLFMRPIPGWSNHKTPIDGLYLCGSGVHGGGGVSGAAGRNLARMLG